MLTKCLWVIHGSLTSERKASTSPSSFIDPAAQSSAQAPSSLSLHALRSSSARQAQTQSESERVDALGQRAVKVIICMITRDFSVISMTSQASLSLSLPLTKVTDAQYRKRFRASYNIVYSSLHVFVTSCLWHLVMCHFLFPESSSYLRIEYSLVDHRRRRIRRRRKRDRS